MNNLASELKQHDASQCCRCVHGDAETSGEHKHTHGRFKGHFNTRTPTQTIYNLNEPFSSGHVIAPHVAYVCSFHSRPFV